MALPELIANSSTPGTVTALTMLSSELHTGAHEMSVGTVAPPALHASGQFRIVLNSEILLIDGPSAATTTWTILERAAEGSSEAAHASGTSVYNILTAAALKSALVANSPAVNNSPVVMSFGTFEPSVIPGGEPATKLEIGSVINESVTTVGFYQVMSFVENTGTSDSVAVYGSAVGPHAWGGNFVAHTRGHEQHVTGVEIDFGHLTTNAETEPETGSASNGLTIEYFPHKFPVMNEGSLLQFSAKFNEGGSNLGCKWGIRMIGSGGTQGPIVHPTEGTVSEIRH